MAMKQEKLNFAPEVVREALQGLIASDDFDASKRNRRFLEYVVEELLDGRADRIKAYTIATDVFGRPMDFDPQADPIVRIEASRLRRSLERYYLKRGKADRLRISLPKGHYVPEFSANLTEEEPETKSHEKVPTTVSVCPFDFDTERTETNYAVKNISRTIIAGLSRFPTLSVRELDHAWNGAEVRSDVGDTAPQDERYVLNGGAYLTENCLRVEVILETEASANCIWAKTYQRNFECQEELLFARDAVSNEIVRAIAQPYGAIYSARIRHIEATPTSDLKPYQAITCFYQYLFTLDAELFERARIGLENAIRHSPDSAEVHACLSQIYTDGFRFERNLPTSIKNPLEHARELARRAMELSPSSCRGYHALGLVRWFSNDIEGALELLEVGHSKNRNDAEVVADLGWRYAMRMDWDRAEHLLNLAYSMNPARSPAYRIGLALAHLGHGRFDRALQETGRMETEHLVFPHLIAALAYRGLGDMRNAEASVAKIDAIAPDYLRSMRQDLTMRQLHPDLVDRFVNEIEAISTPGAESEIAIKSR